MAKKNQSEGAPVGKSFKPDVGKFDSLAVGDVLTGVFMGARHQQITDTRTRKPKSVFVIKLRETETDEVKKIACATMLERAFEDLVDEYGNGDETTAINRLRGTKLTLTRGEDERTQGGNQIGTYEIFVHEAE